MEVGRSKQTTNHAIHCPLFFASNQRTSLALTQSSQLYYSLRRSDSSDTITDRLYNQSISSLCFPSLFVSLSVSPFVSVIFTDVWETSIWSRRESLISINCALFLFPLFLDDERRASHTERNNSLSLEGSPHVTQICAILNCSCDDARSHRSQYAQTHMCITILIAVSFEQPHTFMMIAFDDLMSTNRITLRCALSHCQFASDATQVAHARHRRAPCNLPFSFHNDNYHIIVNSSFSMRGRHSDRTCTLTMCRHAPAHAVHIASEAITTQ